MQYAEGRSWREEMTNFLNEKNITVFDPYKKPFINSPVEDENIWAELKGYMDWGNFSKVSAHMKEVRAFDLSMVDKSDFIVCYLNPATPTFGTMEELAWAVRMKRPVFMVIEGGKNNAPFWVMGMLPHKYIYNDWGEVKDVIDKIDKGDIVLDSDRWRLLRPELR